QDPGCLSLGDVWPGASEDGAWAAVRFQTGNTDTIVIDSVDFTLRHGHSPDTGVTCDASGPFELRLMIGDSVPPPDGDGVTAPATVATTTFPQVTLSGVTERLLEYEFPSLIVVGPSKQIHVALDSHVNGSLRTCFKTC